MSFFKIVLHEALGINAFKPYFPDTPAFRLSQCNEVQTFSLLNSSTLDWCLFWDRAFSPPSL